MKTIILLHLPVIQTEHGGYFYSGFYLLAFLVAMTIFMIESKKNNKIPGRTALLVIATAVLFFILGNKLFAINPASWKNIFWDPLSFSHEGKTILGGIIGLGIALLISGRWLALKNLADRLALALPIGMMVTRVGCLMAGCCFGNPSPLPWAIQYGPHSDAFFSQLDRNLVSSLDTVSLPVHPVPVYEMIGCIGIFLAVWLSRKYWKAPGSRLLFMIMMYGIVRFFLEFFRDPAGNKFAGTEFLGIKYVQWCVLCGSIILGVILCFRESGSLRTAKMQTAGATGVFRYISLSAFLLIIYFIVFIWFSPLERFMAGLALLPAIGNAWWMIFRRMTIPSLRIFTCLLPILGLLFMSQTYIPDKKENKIHYTEVSFGAMYNAFSVFPDYAYTEDCGDPVMRPAETRRDNYYTIGGGYSTNWIYANDNRASFGIDGFLGLKTEKYRADSMGSLNSSSIIQIGISGYYSHDWRWGGIKGGIIAGYFNIDGLYTVARHTGDYSGLLLPLYVFPQVSLRAGPMDIAFLDVRLNDLHAGMAPSTMMEFGLGSGLGKFNGTMLRAGFKTNFNEEGREHSSVPDLYSQVVLPIKEKYVLDFYASSNFASGDKSRNCISVGFDYRFGYTTVPKKIKQPRHH